MKPRVLVVDDEPPQLEILRLILGSEGYEVATAASGRGALAALRRQPFDVVLTDLKMPDLSGIALLEEILREQPGACVVLMTAHGTIDSAVEAMRKGAFDYLTKPLDREVLLLAVSRAVERTRLVSENRRLREELRGRFRLENIVGAHGSMQEVFRIVHKVARSELDRAHLRRERHRQGAGGARASTSRATGATARSSPSTWRRCPESDPRGGAVRLREGRLHRGRRAQDRPLRAGLAARRSSSTRSAS